MDEIETLAPLCFVLMPFGKKLDAASPLASAEEAYEKALALNPNDAYALVNLGESLQLRARVALGSGLDPAPLLDRAESRLLKALEINPNHAQARAGLALLPLVAGRIGWRWSMTALAREAGLNLCTVSRIEHGLRANPQSVKRVADALGLPMEEVLREDVA